MADIKKNVKIELKEIIKETSDIYTFVFKKPKDFDWIPGQHGVYKFTDREIKEGKDFRIFSFASIKEENVIMFSTRIVEEPSEFKKNLLKLESGDVMTVDGPMGKFLLNDTEKPICIMAGGIGVTPIRSFMKQLENKNTNPKYMNVLYSDDRGEFAYKDTLNKINNKIDGLDFEFISDRNVFTDKIDEFANDYKNEAFYYMSGTPGMTDFLTTKLMEMGIEKENIKTDKFMGY